MYFFIRILYTVLLRIHIFLQVFLPINEKEKHWFLAQFHIKTGVVTFYDSGDKHISEWRPWYLEMRACLQV